jgi:hypothetical protein
VCFLSRSIRIRRPKDRRNHFHRQSGHRAALHQLAFEVGLPIDPPDRNVNSRFGLETAELVRAKRGDGAAGAISIAAGLERD